MIPATFPAQIAITFLDLRSRNGSRPDAARFGRRSNLAIYIMIHILYSMSVKYAMILNPASGRGRSLRLLPKIAEWAAEKKVEFELFTTTAPGEGTKLGQICVFRDFERVVVVGGDGTINEVGSALAGTNVTMGIIPGGSGNDFYKMLGNGRSLNSGLETAFFGKQVEIDIGLINDRPFFNAVGIGFDAEVAQRASQITGRSGMMVYLTAVFQSLKHLQAKELELEFDKVKIQSKVTLVCIGNGKSTGGGFYLTPHARFDDALLDICVMEELPRRKVFTYLPRTLNGSHVRLPGVKIYRSKKIIISSYKELPIHIDGEPVTEPIKKVEIGIDSHKLRVAIAK